MYMRTLFVALSALMLAACGGGGSKSSGPEAVAENFIRHLNNMEFTEAKAYGTESTGKILDMMAGFAGMGDPADKPEAVGFKILDTDIQGEKAFVTYQNEDAEEPETLTLIQENGKWLVHMDKEDMDKEDEGEPGMMDDFEDMDMEMMEEEMRDTE
jgi:hypothetical protein